MKKRLLVLLCVVVVLLCGCSNNGFEEFPEADVIAFVTANQDTLMQIISLELPEYTEDIHDINQKLGEESKIVAVEQVNEQILRFYWKYDRDIVAYNGCGFYYSKNDQPIPIVFQFATLQELTPGVYEWKSNTYRHSVRTVKISDNWYYYAFAYNLL